MAGKGPLPKIAGQRQRRNKRRVVAMVPLREKPPAVNPKWLKQTRVAWVKYWTSPVSDVIHRATEEPTVYRLFTLMDFRERAARSFARHPFIRGSQGQEIVNPQAALMMKMDQELRMMGQELGLSPAARLRLGIETETEEKPGGLSEEWTADDVDEVKDPRLKVVK